MLFIFLFKKKLISLLINMSNVSNVNHNSVFNSPCLPKANTQGGNSDQVDALCCSGIIVQCEGSPEQNWME